MLLSLSQRRRERHLPLSSNMGSRSELVYGSGVTFVGLVGAIVHGSLAIVEMEPLANQFLGVWFAAFFGFSGLQYLYNVFRRDSRLLSSRVYYWTMAYLLLVIVANFICAVALGIAGPTSAPGTAWVSQ